MMGYGPSGYDGSYSSSSSPSSSSNLSPLAPPFMIDRSFTKHSSTPLVDLTESSLSYAAPLSSSLHNWLPSPKPTSRPQFFPNQKLESGYVPSSNAFRYRGIQKMESSNTQLPPMNTVPSTSADVLAFGQCSDTVAANLVEAQPYYPSYLPCTTDNSSPLLVPDQTSYDLLSTSHVPSLGDSSLKGYTQRSSTSKSSAPWDGLWNELGDSELGKQRKFDGGLFSMETVLPVSFYNNYMDQGTQRKDLNTCHVESLGIDTLELGRHGGRIQTERLDDQFFLGQNPNFTPIDGAKPVFGYGELKASFNNFKMSTENLIDESFMRQNPNFMPADKIRCNIRVGGIDPCSSNSQLPNNASYERHMRQHDVSLNDRASISKSSPVVVIKSPATVSSTSAVHIASLKAPNFGSGATDPDICSNNPSSKIELHQTPPNSEGKLFFDPGQLRAQVEKNGPIFSEALLTKNEDVLNNGTVNNDALDNWSKDKYGLGTSNLDHDDFNLDLKANQMTNSVESLPETVDSCSLTVDSPCWRGVPLASPWKGCEFEALIPQQMKKQEECNNLNVLAKELFVPGTSYATSFLKSSENTVHPEFGLGLHLNVSSGVRSTFGEQKSVDTPKGNCHLECSDGVQHSNYTCEIESGFKSYFDSTDSHIMQQSLRQEGLTSDVDNDASENFSSQMPSNVMDHFLCSSEEDESTKLSKSIDQQSIPTIDVMMLVNAMHSISDVLLFHCTNGLCPIKEKELGTIKSVISNLNMCWSKNAEKVVAISKSNYSLEKTSDYLAGRNDLHEPTKTAYPSTPDKHCMSNKEDNKVSESSSMGGDPGILEDDKMVQALKKVLGENFNDDDEKTRPRTLMYKNLWLEAEAALCAVNYKARFNRMKRDMKYSSTSDVPKSNAELLRPYASHEPDKVQVVLPRAENFPNSKVKNSPILNTSSQGDDDVMARLRILQCRIDNLSTANADEPSNSRISPDATEVNKELYRSHEANCDTKPDICNQDSNITRTNNHANDFEASIKARFHILKLRDVVCSSVSKENPRSGNIGFGNAGKRIDWSIIGPRLEDASSCKKMEHNLQHHSAGNEGIITMKEFHLFDEEDQLVQPPRRTGCGNQPHGGQHECLSSDWEHVMDEEHNH